MEQVETHFLPQVHGFSFQNSFDFPNFFQIKLPFIPSSQTSLADLIYGLCEGMCFSALDYYYAEILPPRYAKTEDIPWPFFLYLWQRQLNSLRNPVLIKLFEWMLSNNIDLAKKMHRWEIPKVKKILLTGDPVPLVLVREKGILDPIKNHQVIATGYEFNPMGKELKIFLYNPNYPGEQPNLTMSLKSINQGIDLSESTGEQIYGFFVIDYMKKTPMSDS